MDRAYVARQIHLAKTYMVGGNETAARDAIARALSQVSPAQWPTPDHVITSGYASTDLLRLLCLLGLDDPTKPTPTVYPPPNG